MSRQGGLLKAFLLLPGQSGGSVAHGMALIEKMNEKQQWAVEECCKIKGMNAYKALEIIELLGKISKTDVWNARGLFKQNISPEVALYWVEYYFQRKPGG